MADVAAKIEAIAGQFSDQWWRLNNLYKIKNKDGKIIQFRPNSQQTKLWEELHFNTLVLKARQFGFSTFIDLLALDTALWNSNISAVVISYDRESAEELFGRIKFTHEQLLIDYPVWAEKLAATTDNARELEFCNGSRLAVTTTARGGTHQILHVSEFGKICAKYPDKAREIVTGSLETVGAGNLVVIESTAEGQEGAFYDYCQEARRLADLKIRPNIAQWKFVFVPWWQHPDYQMPASNVEIPDADQKRLIEIEGKIGRKLTAEQRAWWSAKRARLREDMGREYPSTPDEAFESALEGVYYSEQMAECRRGGRVAKVPYMPGIPVNTFWDIGANDHTAIWLHQLHAGMHRLIGFIEDTGKPFSYYVGKLQALGYVWGADYLPHDAAHARQGKDSNKCAQEMLRDLGRASPLIVPRTPMVITGINQTRDLFPLMTFDSEACREGLHHLDHYRKQWDERHGRWMDEPLHDGHSDCADALRQLGQAVACGMVVGGAHRQRQASRRPANWRTG